MACAGSRRVRERIVSLGDSSLSEAGRRPLPARVPRARRAALTPPWRAGLGLGEGPVEPVHQRGDVAMPPRSRRTRCAGREARRDRRRCRGRRPASRAGPRPSWRTPPARRPAGDVTAGSTNTRQTLVLERIAASLARKSIQSCCADEVGDRLGVGVGPGDERVQPADRLRPVERVDVVLDAEHGRAC